MEDDRIKEAVPLAVAVEMAMPAMPELTEAEWQARDLDVQAQLAAQKRQEATERWLVDEEELIRRGLSKMVMRMLFGDPGEHVRTPALDVVDGLPHQEGAIWCLSGNVGCGKTFAAHKWLVGDERALVQPSLVQMVTAASFARTSRYDSSKFDAGSSARLLVIDDLGAEYADTKDSFLADLDELIDMRWRRGLQTLITTNLVKKLFRTRYGNRIIDRIRQYGGWHEVKHPSLRGGTD